MPISFSLSILATACDVAYRSALPHQQVNTRVQREFVEVCLVTLEMHEQATERHKYRHHVVTRLLVVLEDLPVHHILKIVCMRFSTCVA